MKWHWYVLEVLCGLFLWVLICWGPLQVEWSQRQPDFFLVTAFLAPLLLLLIGFSFRNSYLLILLFPSSFIFAILSMDSIEYKQFESFFGICVLGLFTISYLAISAYAAGELKYGQGNPGTSGLRSPSITVQDVLRKIRMGLLVVLFLLPLHKLNFHPDSQSLSTEERLLFNVVWLFIFLVIAYLYFYIPGLAVELDKRVFAAKQEALRKSLANRAQNLMVIYLALAMILLLSTMFIFMVRTG